MASSLRRERAVLEQKKQQLERTAAVLRRQKEDIEAPFRGLLLEGKRVRHGAEP